MSNNPPTLTIGLRDPPTSFKVGYHEQRLEDVAAVHANSPLELPADHTVVSEAIDQALQPLASSDRFR